MCVHRSSFFSCFTYCFVRFAALWSNKEEEEEEEEEY